MSCHLFPRSITSDRVDPSHLTKTLASVGSQPPKEFSVSRRIPNLVWNFDSVIDHCGHVEW
jgi:hypothetical protein